MRDEIPEVQGSKAEEGRRQDRRNERNPLNHLRIHCCCLLLLREGWGPDINPPQMLQTFTVHSTVRLDAGKQSRDTVPVGQRAWNNTMSTEKSPANRPNSPGS